MLVEIIKKNCTKFVHCLLLVSWLDFVIAIQKIIQSFRCILYLFDLCIMMLLRLLLDIVIVPNVVELVHLYNLLFARHILVNQRFLVVFDLGKILLFLYYQCINSSAFIIKVINNFLLFHSIYWQNYY